MHQGVYHQLEENIFESTHLANAGWYEEGQHGGALSALIGSYAATIPVVEPMATSRLTVELFRIVPITRLFLSHRVVREGKRIQLSEISVRNSEGLELARANIQRLRNKDVSVPSTSNPPPPVVFGPQTSRLADMASWGVGPADKTMFHRNAIEVREAAGGFNQPGPATVWIKLLVPIIDQQPVTPLQRVLVAADFCNGISRPDLDNRRTFMNPDLTVSLVDLPSSEWVSLSAESSYGFHGRGVATGTLWDESRFLGRSTQTLFLDVDDDLS